MIILLQVAALHLISVKCHSIKWVIPISRTSKATTLVVQLTGLVKVTSTYLLTGRCQFFERFDSREITVYKMGQTCHSEFIRLPPPYTGIWHIYLKLSPFEHQEQNYYPSPIYYIYSKRPFTIYIVNG